MPNSDATLASKKMFDMAGVKYRQFEPKGQRIIMTYKEWENGYCKNFCRKN